MGTDTPAVPHGTGGSFQRAEHMEQGHSVPDRSINHFPLFGVGSERSAQMFPCIGEHLRCINVARPEQPDHPSRLPDMDGFTVAMAGVVN